MRCGVVVWRAERVRARTEKYGTVLVVRLAAHLSPAVLVHDTDRYEYRGEETEAREEKTAG